MREGKGVGAVDVGRQLVGEIGNVVRFLRWNRGAEDIIEGVG